MIQIVLTLKSFEYFYLEKNKDFLYNLIYLIKRKKKLNKLIHSKVFLKKKNVFTVNCSPHIDKKSREQFYFKYYTKKINIANLTFKQTLFFLFLIKNSIMYATQIEINLFVNTFYIK